MSILEKIDEFVREIENDTYIGEGAEFLGSKVASIVATVMFMEDSELKEKVIKELPKIKEAFAKKGMAREEYATEIVLNDLVFNEESPLKDIESTLKKMMKDIIEIDDDINDKDFIKGILKRAKIIDVSVKIFNDVIVFEIGNKKILSYEEIEKIIIEVSKDIDLGINLKNIRAIYGTEKMATLEIVNMEKKIVLNFKNVDMTASEIGYYLDGFKQYLDK